MVLRYSPSLFDRLFDDHPTLGASDSGAPADLTLEQLKDAIARDLEGLLNTRLALPDALLAPYPACRNSILSYGLIDFAGMCLTSSVDRDKICASLKSAIERHEPRLHGIRASLQRQEGSINRVNFVISALLETHPAMAPVEFAAVLQPTTQTYSVRHGVAVPAAPQELPQAQTAT
jgi:type VI secretion system protein ImpF